MCLQPQIQYIQHTKSGSVMSVDFTLNTLRPHKNFRFFVFHLVKLFFQAFVYDILCFYCIV